MGKYIALRNERFNAPENQITHKEDLIERFDRNSWIDAAALTQHLTTKRASDHRITRLTAINWQETLSEIKDILDSCDEGTVEELNMDWSFRVLEPRRYGNYYTDYTFIPFTREEQIIATGVYTSPESLTYDEDGYFYAVPAGRWTRHEGKLD